MVFSDIQGRFVVQPSRPLLFLSELQHRNTIPSTRPKCLGSLTRATGHRSYVRCCALLGLVSRSVNGTVPRPCLRCRLSIRRAFSISTT